MPKVSVIVPVYNIEKYIQLCVDSVLNQTFTEFELILVDDGSQDSSGQICDSYAEKDNRVRVAHIENGGQGHARNVGVSLARGDFIEFLDGDDWITPDTLEFLVNEAESKSLDLVLFAAHSFVDGDPKEFNVIINEYNRSHNFDVVFDGVTCYKKMMEYDEYITQMGMRFFSASYYRKHGFAFQEGKLHEDEVIGFLSVILADRVEIVDKRFYQRRYRAGSAMTSRTQIASLRGYATALADLSRAYRKRKLFDDMEEPLVERIIIYLKRVQSIFLASDNGEKAEIYKETQPILKKGLRYGVPLDKKSKIAEKNLFRYEAYLKREQEKKKQKKKAKRDCFLLKCVRWIKRHIFKKEL